jgi:hypothetical protein
MASDTFCLSFDVLLPYSASMYTLTYVLSVRIRFLLGCGKQMVFWRDDEVYIAFAWRVGKVACVLWAVELH